MNVRPANIADIERCERLDSSFVTSHIWHMDETVQADRIDVSFRRVRIPRQMEMRDPNPPEDLFAVWQHSRCFLVAEEKGVILGYMSLIVRRRTWQGWIEHLVVHRPYRRRGIASLLLAGAERWAQGSDLRGLAAVVQNKNDPAINLFPRRGYAFRGYIDGHFANGDLGLLYTLDI